MTAGLAKQGVEVNEKRVARLMGEMGIAGRAGRRKVRTTWRDKRQQAAVDLVLRHFTAAGPDQTWVGDITYVPTGEGWLFVASVLDVCSRMMVGWSIADHLRTELCADALEAAVATRGEVRMTGTVFHSDHGCQYTSDDFKALCRRLGIRQSMGTVGDSYDKAVVSYCTPLRCWGGSALGEAGAHLFDESGVAWGGRFEETDVLVVGSV